MDSNLDQENYLVGCHISALDGHTEGQNEAADVALHVGRDPTAVESSKGHLDQDDVNHCSLPLDIDHHTVAGVNVSVLENSEEVPFIEPYEGMEFESEEAARLFYNAYAMHSGFGSRVSRNRRSRKDGENIARNFVCSKEGYRANRHGNTDGRTRRQRAVTREGCGAMITIKKVSNGKWAVTKFVREHNHPLLSPSEVRALRSHKITLELKKASTEPHTNEDTETAEVLDEVAADESSGILEPYEGMELESEEAARILYNTYARKTGFRSRISKNRRSRKDGEVIARKFVCCKEGFRAKQHENKKDRIYRPRAITRLGCEAMIMVKKQSSGKWIVAKFVKEHNHALLDPSKLVFPRSHKNADVSRKMIETLDSDVGMSEMEVVSSGLEGQNNCDLIMNGFNNHVEIIRKRKRSPDRSIQYFLDYLRCMQSENPAFFYATQLDEEESLCCIFWADARSRLAYNYFGDVVYFSSIHRTANREVPFGSFTGLNHHQQPTLFGCVMLFKLVESSFVWIFKTWLEAMSGRHPVTLITNQDEAIEVAISHVFPKTHHCIPPWQILNEAQEHLVDIHPCLLDEFQKCICLTETIHDFESDWKSFASKYDLKDNEWLQALYNARQRWVPVYLQDTFFAQIPTCKQGKGIDSFFDGFIDASSTLQEFVAEYERAVSSWHEKEHEEDVQTVRTKPALKSRLPIEKQMADIYTRTVFLHFQEEVYESLGYVATKIKEEGAAQTYKVSCYEEQRRACTVTCNMSERRVTCSCLMFEFSGILCRHALIVLTAADIVSVPAYYILERWSRNAKSGVGLERRGVAMQTNCRKSLNLRYSDLCKQAIRCAEVGATSVQDYDVAVRALREALDKINASKKKVGRITQFDSSVNNICQDDGINRESDVDITPNSISLCDPQQSRARGRPRNSSSKSVLERTHKSIKCTLCRENGHDKSMCPRLRSIEEPFVNAGGMILDMGPTDLHGHGVIGGEQPGFSDGILCLSLGDHFESHVTPGIPNFGPNNFFFR